MITNIIIATIAVSILLAMGVLLINGKAAFLIAGYNTMNKKDKSYYEEKALCRFVGWLMLGIGLSVGLIILFDFLDWAFFTYTLVFVTKIGLIVAIIYANTGNRFRKKIPIEEGEGNQ